MACSSRSHDRKRASPAKIVWGLVANRTNESTVDCPSSGTQYESGAELRQVYVKAIRAQVDAPVPSLGLGSMVGVQVLSLIEERHGLKVRAMSE